MEDIMTLEQILDQWAKDSAIDRTEVGIASSNQDSCT